MKYWKWTAGVVAAIVVAAGAYYYWREQILYPSTDDAYVHANVVQISPQVTGMIMNVPVHDHERVAKGQLLLEIDPQPFTIALDQAGARLELARQQYRAAQAAVKAARAVVAQRRAQLTEAADNARRISRLYHQHTVSKSQLDQATAGRDSARAGLKQAQAQLREARQQTQAAQASVKVASTAVDKARLELSYTRISAPGAGELGSVDVQPGSVVDSSQALMPLVLDHSFYIDANFKETDLKRIRAGQPATVQVGLYPGGPLHGRVASIAPASGAAFSLLPPENATGNWVKVTQRFPVRIALSDRTVHPPLRIGASATVTVDTSALSNGG